MNVSEVSKLVAFRLAEKFVEVSALTALTYDYLLTFHLEVEHVWKSNWNIVKILFLLARYIAFIDVPLRIVVELAPGFTHRPRFCSVFSRVPDILTAIGIGSAGSILIIRTLALWGNGRKMMIALIMIFSPIYTAAFICFTMFSLSLQFSEPPVDIIPGCWLSNVSSIVFIIWLILLAAETIIMILTLLAWGRQHSRMQLGDGLIWTLYRDGMLYYIYIFFFSVANLIMMNTKPRSCSSPHQLGTFGMLAYLQRAMHSIFSSRIVLQMREANVKAEPTFERSISELRFRGAAHNTTDRSRSQV